MLTADKIKELVEGINGISLIDDFAINETGSLKGRIAVATSQNNADLEWDVHISPTYPFKAMGREPIHFQNKSLLDYPLLCKTIIFACTLRNMRMLKASLRTT